MLVWTSQVFVKPATPERRVPSSILTGLPAAAAVIALVVQASCVISARDRARSGEPVWLEPAASSIVTQPAVFRWMAVPGADAYRLRVGSAPGGHDLLNIHAIPSTTTSYRADELPGMKPLYARVSAHRDGEWRHADIRFTAERVAAEWIYPTPGSPEVNPAHAFEWTPVQAATEYRVEIGTATHLSDVLDRTVEGLTRIRVAELPRGRRLTARLSTRVRGSWYSRDADFAVAIGYHAAEPLHPRPGGSANQRRPFAWQPVLLATGYRLRIGATPGSAALFDSGILGVSSTFVADLPTRRTLHATLTTVYVNRTIERRFEFQVEPGTTDEDGFVDAALAATVEVRRMAGPRGAWSRTLLADVVSQEHVAGPGCVEFAQALVRALRQQRNRLPARLLNTCLLGNGYDCHTLVELYLPRSGRWMLLDPTFAVTARRRDREWATAGDVSDAVRRGDWNEYHLLGTLGRHLRVAAGVLHRLPTVVRQALRPGTARPARWSLDPALLPAGALAGEGRRGLCNPLPRRTKGGVGHRRPSYATRLPRNRRPFGDSRRVLHRGPGRAVDRALPSAALRVPVASLVPFQTKLA